MLEHNEKNDKLVRQYREFCDKAENATDEKEKEHYKKLAEAKRDEMFIAEFGDKNYKRFNQY